MLQDGLYDRVREKHIVEAKMAEEMLRDPRRMARFVILFRKQQKSAYIPTDAPYYIDPDDYDDDIAEPPWVLLNEAGHKELSSICPSLPWAIICSPPRRRIYPRIDFGKDRRDLDRTFHMCVYSGGITYRVKVSTRVTDMLRSAREELWPESGNSAQVRLIRPVPNPVNNYYSIPVPTVDVDVHTQLVHNEDLDMPPLGWFSLDNTTSLRKNIPSADTATECTDETKCCVVCVEHVKTIFIVPCGHNCLCPKCAHKYVDTMQENCPVCRAKIEKLMPIFE